MKVSMNVTERLALLSILPGEGNLATIRQARVLREDLSLSEDEHKTFEFKVLETGGFQWNPNKAQSKEFTLNASQIGMIDKALRTLDAQNKVQVHHETLYELFNVEPKE